MGKDLKQYDPDSMKVVLFYRITFIPSTSNKNHIKLWPQMIVPKVACSRKHKQPLRFFIDCFPLLYVVH